jgi:hypothetical protein
MQIPVSRGQPCVGITVERPATGAATAADGQRSVITLVRV